MIKFEVFAPYEWSSDAYIDVHEVIAIGPSWVRDVGNQAAHVRTIRLRGGSEIEILDSPENWQKLETRCCSCAQKGRET